MASSLQTLIKILRLEQQKGNQNKAVIGGFGRFAYHWAREAHGQAKTDTHHNLVDEIAHLLRDYENSEQADRTQAIEHIIALATGQVSVDEEGAGAPPAPREEEVLRPSPERRNEQEGIEDQEEAIAGR